MESESSWDKVFEKFGWSVAHGWLSLMVKPFNRFLLVKPYG